MRNLFNAYGIPFLVLCILLIICHLDGYITAMALCSIIWLIRYPYNIYRTTNSALIVVFSLTYCFFAYISGAMTELPTMVATLFPLITLYGFGNYLYSKTNNENHLISALFLIILCYCGQYFYDTIFDIIKSGQLVSTNRIFLFQEGSDEITNSTHVGTNVAFGFIGLPAFFILEKNQKIRWGFLGIFILALLTTIHLVNRAGIVEGIMLLAVFFLYYSRFKKDNTLKWLFVLFLIILVGYFLGFSDGSVFDAYRARNEVVVDDSRSYRWTTAIVELINNPFGWYSFSNQDYWVHNMWLDIAKRAGWIPFVLLVVLTINSVKTTIALTKKTEGNALSMILLFANISFFLSCFVEPIIGGLHLGLYMMLWGIQDRWMKEFYVMKSE